MRSLDRPAKRQDRTVPVLALSKQEAHARFVVIGDVAGALNGWPVMLGSRTLQIVPADSSTRRVEQAFRRLGAEPAGDAPDGQDRWLLPNGGEIRVTPVVAGHEGLSRPRARRRDDADRPRCGG